MTIKCLLNTAQATNIQQGLGRCDKVMNKYITKAGETITEVISDYGKGLTTKSEIFDFENKIKQTLTNGNTITYTKNHVGDVLVKEGATETINKNPELWNRLLNTIYKGF